MGIVYIKKLNRNSKLGLWLINESIAVLLKKLHMNNADITIYQSKKSDRRKREWLASRNLLQEMLKVKAAVLYDKNGKPYLESDYCQISISHSGKYACVYTDKVNPVGVDIQELKVTTQKGSDFFTSKTEQSWINPMDNVMLNIIWSVKETVFKCWGINEIDIKKDINVFPFVSNQNGVIEVSILNHGLEKRIMVGYEIFDNYVLTRTI